MSERELALEGALRAVLRALGSSDPQVHADAHAAAMEVLNPPTVELVPQETIVAADQHPDVPEKEEETPSPTT